MDLEAGALSVRQDMVPVTGRGMVAAPPKTARSARTVVLLPQAVEDLKRQKAMQAEEPWRASCARSGGRRALK